MVKQSNTVTLEDIQKAIDIYVNSMPCSCHLRFCHKHGTFRITDEEQRLIKGLFR